MATRKRQRHTAATTIADSTVIAVSETKSQPSKKSSAKHVAC